MEGGRNFRSGDTKEHLVVSLPKRWAAQLTKLLKGELVGAKDLTYRNGCYFFAGQRKDGLWVAARLVVENGLPDQLVCGKPYRQILGHTVGGDQALYVAFPDNSRDNWPRVVWGKSEGRPYEVIDHEHLVWVDGEPLYLAIQNGQTIVVRGSREGKPYDRVEELLFVAGRPLYRARRGKEMLIVWGNDESEPYDDISPPEFDGKEITAWATKSLRLYRLTAKVA